MKKMNEIRFFQTPELSRPYLIAGFSGWPNAGEISTTTLTYLKEKLQSRKFGEILPDLFYDFSSTRPLAVVGQGELKELKLPQNELFFWTDPDAPHDLVLLQGQEPNLSWHRYADNIFQLCEGLGVEMIFTVGGTYDYVTHWQEPLVSALANPPELHEKLTFFKTSRTDYPGPISIHTLLLDLSRPRNIPCISFWGHAPMYIQTGNIKVCRRIIEIIKGLVQLPLDLKDLDQSVQDMDQQINRLIQQNPKLQEYIKNLEEKPRPGKRPAAEERERGKIIRLNDFFRREPELPDKEEGEDEE